MNDLAAPDIAIGGFVLAASIFYAAWYEYREKNQRDAKLLVAVGAVSLMAGAATWL